MSEKDQPLQKTDNRPISGSGLPNRIVRAARNADLHTFGDLRHALSTRPAIPGIGKRSRAHITAFLEKSDRLNTPPFPYANLRDALSDLFTEKDRWLLERRFGLYRPDPALEPRYCTLKEIANEDQCSREYVRQRERDIIRFLHSGLVQRALKPFVDDLSALFRLHAGVLDARAIPEDWPSAGPYNPRSAVFLLALHTPPEACWIDGILSRRPPAQLSEARKTLCRILDRQQAPVPEEILLDNREPLPLPLPAIRVLLRHMPGLLFLKDRRVLYSPLSITRWIGREMSARPRPIHYRELARALNAQLEAASRQNARFYLKVLNADSVFDRTAHGVYDLAGNHETD